MSDQKPKRTMTAISAAVAMLGFPLLCVGGNAHVGSMSLAEVGALMILLGFFCFVINLIRGV